MRIAIFGGSFDPIHKGHINLAKSAKKLLGIDVIYFVPSGRPVHKLKVYSGAGHRVNMVRLALSGLADMKVSLYEARKKSPSYSYQTIKYFSAKFPKSEIFFLAGDDAVASLKKWKMGFKLLDMCVFVAGRRSSPAESGIPKKYRTRVVFLNNPVKKISSSDIRARIKKGLSVSNFLPAKVAGYIKQKGLYA